MERIKFRNLAKKLTKNADYMALVLGSSILVGSFIDDYQNEALHNQHRQLLEIRKDLDLKYQTYLTCTTGAVSQGAFDVACYRVVKGVKSPAEREKVLEDYHQEYENRAKEVPVDEHAQSQRLRDALGVLLGVCVATIGIAGIQDKFRRRDKGVPEVKA